MRSGGIAIFFGFFRPRAVGGVYSGMQTITKQEAAAIIASTGGTVFSVTFVKRTTGEVREMRCILGSRTTKGLTGGERAYDPDAHGLVWVYLMAGDVNRDADPKHRRSIPVEGITGLKANGKQYQVI